MAIELGMVNVTVRRDALRRVGIEAECMERVRGSEVHTADHHLVNLASMSGADAYRIAQGLLETGLENGKDIADQTSDWLETDTLRDEPPICFLRRAWLRGTDPAALVEMPWLKEKRDRIPGPRPWAK
jgi:hypothetical protein